MTGNPFLLWPAAVALALVQFAPAFVALDQLFRVIPVAPESLPGRLTRWALFYGGLAAIFGVGGGWIQWRIAGTFGLAAALLNWIPWWMLWRFGLRKQFTYLFKPDGGRSLEAEKPDP